MLVCDDCWQLYNGNHGVLEAGQPCPKRDCGGELADIDELLLPAIQLLNVKGYFTESCCSGHFYEYPHESAYITFEDFVDKKHFQTMPKGFHIDKDYSDKVVIRRGLKGEDEYDFHRAAVEASLDVLAWAEDLDPINDEDY